MGNSKKPFQAPNRPEVVDQINKDNQKEPDSAQQVPSPTGIKIDPTENTPVDALFDAVQSAQKKNKDSKSYSLDPSNHDESLGSSKKKPFHQSQVSIFFWLIVFVITLGVWGIFYFLNQKPLVSTIVVHPKEIPTNLPELAPKKTSRPINRQAPPPSTRPKDEEKELFDDPTLEEPAPTAEDLDEEKLDPEPDSIQPTSKPKKKSDPEADAHEEALKEEIIDEQDIPSDSTGVQNAEEALD